MNLMTSDSFEKNKTLIISSAMPKEGKSMIAVNLAVTMAHAGMKVLLVDCDFRKPAQHTILKTDNSIGLVDLIKNKTIKGNIKRTSYPNLFLLPSGNIEKIVVPELINNSNLITSISNFQSHFDHIIVDTPPINLYTDAAVLSSNFKKVLFIMKYNTPRDPVMYANKIITNLNASIIGVVVNYVHESRFFGGYYKYEYGYGYGYGYYHGYKKSKKIPV